MISIPNKEEVFKSLAQLYPSVNVFSVLQKIPNSRVFVYGGLLRDLALGKKPKEADILVINTGLYKEFENKVENILEQNGFVMLGKVANENRANYHYLPPNESKLTSGIDINIKQKLDNPIGDFTINSFCMDLYSGELFDSKVGIRDLEQKILRTTDDPKEVFKKKPLLIFRAIKCVCQFGLEIDPATREGLDDSSASSYETMEYVADHKQTLLGEWMLDNMFRGLAYNPAKYFLLQKELGILDIFLSFISSRLNLKNISKNSAQFVLNPFSEKSTESYEDNLSIFFSIFVDSLTEKDQGNIFTQIVSLWGIDLPNKYHYVGINAEKMRYCNTTNKFL